MVSLRGRNMSPRLEVGPFYAFSVMVKDNPCSPGPYDDTLRP